MSKHSVRKILSAFLGIFILLLLLTIVYAWFIRDGMGPDSVESRGIKAMENTLIVLRDAWSILFIELILVIGCLIGILRLKK